jgi:anthranilate phosphoribosyltransferase
MTDFKALIGKVASGKSLTRGEAESAFNVMMSGEATPSQMGAFLMALRVRGETVDEIAGAVATMRAKVLRVEAPADAIDVVGTGGDAVGTYNISTTTAFVVAGAGVPVAKHGNRALSSKSGAADVLTALGVKIDLTPDMVARCISEAGIGFMFAPAHHSAMKFVGPTRVELGTRTIFNLLGPLSNPAGVKRLLVGIFSPQWLKPVAEVLGDLGTEAAWVVHGDGGVDEISISGPTQVAELKGGRVETFEISPSDLGLQAAPLETIKGGDAKQNAEALRAILNGASGPYRDTVILNSAAALIVAGKARDLKEGARLAAASIDEGHARYRLKCLIAVSHG